MSIIRLQKEINRAVWIDVLEVVKLKGSLFEYLDDAFFAVLYNYIQPIRFKLNGENHFLFITALEVMKAAVKRFEEIAKRYSEYRDREELSWGSSILQAGKAFIREFERGDAGFFIVSLPEREVEATRLPKPLFLADAGGNSEDTIPPFAGEFHEGFKSFIVYPSVEGRGGFVNLKIEPLLKVAKVSRILDQYTLEFDLPFDLKFGGSPIFTPDAEFAGLVLGTPTDRGKLKGVNLKFFIDFVDDIFNPEEFELMENTRWVELLFGTLGMEEVNIVKDDSLDDFVLILDGSADGEEQKVAGESGAVSSSPKSENTELKNGRLVVDGGSFEYLAGVREGDAEVVAEDSVFPVYLIIDGSIVGNGTGFIYKQKRYKGEKRSDLFILTNLHVITPLLELASRGDVAVKVGVGGEPIEVEKVISPKGAFLRFNIDEETYQPYDFCVLQVSVETDREFKFFHIKEKPSLKPLTPVVAVGYPLHSVHGFGLTFTKGTISQVYGEEAPNPFLKNVIQIDAAINPGNSGGPLITEDLEVVGINTRGVVRDNNANPVQGLNLAIRMDHVVRTLSDPDALEVINLPKLYALLRGE